MLRAQEMLDLPKVKCKMSGLGRTYFSKVGMSVLTIRPKVGMSVLTISPKVGMSVLTISPKVGMSALNI